MASFKMRNSRTKKYNSDGSRIYNTFNSTGLVNKYENHNARFDSRNKGRELDLVDSNGNKLNNCSCTIAGCGTQCCRNYFLIQNIKQQLWRFSSSSFYGLNDGTVFAPGNIVYTGIVTNPNTTPPLPPSSLTEIGVIEDVLFPNSNACIPLGPDADQDCSGAFPLNVRLIIRSSGGSCALQNTFIESPDMNDQVTGLFFRPPASIPSTASNSGGLWWHLKETASVTDSEVTITHESYRVLGSSKVGAPYRAPIAGYRKTLACCCRSNKGNQKCYKGCHGSCYIEFYLKQGHKFQTPMPMRGEYIYLSDGTFFGTLTDFSYSINNLLGRCCDGTNNCDYNSSTIARRIATNAQACSNASGTWNPNQVSFLNGYSVLRISFKNDDECRKKLIQLNGNAITVDNTVGQIYLYRSDGSRYQHVIFNYDATEPKKDICVSKEATNDVYKDSYAIACQQDTRVCYDKRIRSGMQPKQQFCIDYTKVVGQDGNTYYQKHKRLLCPTNRNLYLGTDGKENGSSRGYQKPYSYSYSQYNKNRAMNTYERGLEKNLRIQGVPNSACPIGSACNFKNVHGQTRCCQRSLYRKSGGNSCSACLNALTCDKQAFEIQNTTDGSFFPWSRTNLPTSTKVANFLATLNNSIITFNGINIGSVSSVSFTALGDYLTVIVTLNDCSKRISYGGQIQFSTNTGSVTSYYNLANPLVQASKPPKNAVTVWKPNNNKFKVQGAVTSGGRMERLKLDTIRSANSKCKKGQRCKDGIGKGPYFAGKPRFTGWMFNSRHRETVCANKYRQQPFGIPQLTNKRRSTRSNHGKSNWNPRSEGTPGWSQRDMITRRAPGCKCPEKQCPKKLCPSRNNDNKAEDFALAIDSNRYELSKCRKTNFSQGVEVIDVTTIASPQVITAGNIVVTLSASWQADPNNPFLLVSYGGYNAFNWGMGTPQLPLNQIIYLASNTQLEEPLTFEGAEIVFFTPSIGGLPGGAIANTGGGSAAMIVLGDLTGIPQATLQSKILTMNNLTTGINYTFNGWQLSPWQGGLTTIYNLDTNQVYTATVLLNQPINQPGIVNVNMNSSGLGASYTGSGDINNATVCPGAPPVLNLCTPLLPGQQKTIEIN